LAPSGFSGAGRISQQRSVIGEALIIEFAEMPPGTELQLAGEPRIGFAVAGAELRLRHDQGGIADAKVEAMVIADLLVVRRWRNRPGRH